VRAFSGVRSTAKVDRPFVTYGLLRTYHELGIFAFKIVVQSSFLSCDVELDVVDADGRPIHHERSDWGRKLRCAMRLDGSVADGMALITVRINKKGFYERFRVVKP